MTRRRAVDARVCLDGVSLRRRAEEALCESEERQRTILRTAMDGFWRIDSHGCLREVNDAYCRMSGYSEQELLSMRVSQLEARDSPSRIASRARRVSAGGPDRFETQHRRKDGTVFDVEVTLQRLVANAGYFVAFLRDISDRVRARDRNRWFSHEVLAAREEERKQISSALHHDVGSLAVGVSAYLEAVEAELVAGEPGRALTGVHRTRKLFDQSVIRLKELAVQLRPPELDVLGICAALRQLFAQTTKQGGTRIRFTETLGRKRVPAELATTLFRVAQEALNNAITHGRATRVDVGLRLTRGAITLTVRDHGQGFDSSDLRAPATRMGLRVMTEMATTAGGICTIAGRPGKGTTVRVTLPLQPGRSRA